MEVHDDNYQISITVIGNIFARVNVRDKSANVAKIYPSRTLVMLQYLIETCFAPFFFSATFKLWPKVTPSIIYFSKIVSSYAKLVPFNRPAFEITSLKTVRDQ